MVLYTCFLELGNSWHSAVSQLLRALKGLRQVPSYIVRWCENGEGLLSKKVFIGVMSRLQGISGIFRCFPLTIKLVFRIN